MDVEKLISVVYERKPLWDPAQKEYHNRDICRKLWMEVAEELDEPCYLIKSKWRNLRDVFRKEQTKLINSGDNGLKKSKWVYFETLMFLKDVVSSRSISNNNAASEESSEGPNTEFEEVSLPVDVNISLLKEEEEEEHLTGRSSEAPFERSRSVASPAVAFKTPPSKRMKRMTEAERQREQEKLEMIKEQSQLYGDSDYHFLLSLIPELKKVPEHRKLHARIRIQQILIEEQQYSPGWNSDSSF